MYSEDDRRCHGSRENPIGERRPEVSAHPGAALLQSSVEMPRSVAEALAESTEGDEEGDEGPSEDSDLDELYENLQADLTRTFKCEQPVN